MISDQRKSNSDPNHPTSTRSIPKNGSEFRKRTHTLAEGGRPPTPRYPRGLRRLASGPSGGRRRARIRGGVASGGGVGRRSGGSTRKSAAAGSPGGGSGPVVGTRTPEGAPGSLLLATAGDRHAVGVSLRVVGVEGLNRILARSPSWEIP